MTNQQRDTNHPSHTITHRSSPLIELGLAVTRATCPGAARTDTSRFSPQRTSTAQTR